MTADFAKELIEEAREVVERMPQAPQIPTRWNLEAQKLIEIITREQVVDEPDAPDQKGN